MTAQRVRICVAEWEIACCAPEPVIGGPTTWALEFAAAGAEPDPLLDEEHEWAVDPGGVLRRGAVTARAWGDDAPAPGIVLLRGRLWGTVHRTPVEIPPVTGRVERIRLLRRGRYRTAGGVEVPGPATAQDVAEYEREDPAPGGVADGGDLFGLLLDVAVRPGSAPPPSG